MKWVALSLSVLSVSSLPHCFQVVATGLQGQFPKYAVPSTTFARRVNGYIRLELDKKMG